MLELASALQRRITSSRIRACKYRGAQNSRETPPERLLAPLMARPNKTHSKSAAWETATTRRLIAARMQRRYLVFLVLPVAPSSALALLGRSLVTCRAGGGAKAGAGGGGVPASRTPCTYAA